MRGIKHRTVLTFVLAFILMSFILVLALGIIYSVPVIDDFNFYDMLRSNQHYPSIFTAAISQALWMYGNWQGAWFTNHLDMFAVGITKLSYTGVRIYLFLSFILFIYALFRLVSMVRFLVDESYKWPAVLVMMNVVVFTGMNLTPAREELYWLTGAGGYTIPMAMAFIGLEQYVQYFLYGKRKSLIGAAVCLMLGCGGALNVAGFACAGGLCIALGFASKIVAGKEDTVSKKLSWLPFAGAVLSAVINVLSPGNFDRLEGESGHGLSVVTALANTIRQLLGRAYVLYKNQYIVMACIIMFFAFLAFRAEGKCIRDKQILYGIVSVVLILGASVFPVSLGYGRVTGQERILFLVDLEIVLAFALVIALVSNMVGEEMAKKNITVNWGTLIPILIFMAYLNIRTIGIGDLMLYKTAREFADGTMHSYCSMNAEMIEDVRGADEQDVEVEVSLVNSGVLLGTGVNDDKDHWVNEAFAACFDKESVRIIFLNN